VRQGTASGCGLEIALPGYSVWLRAWQVQVGRVKLYLLDSNDAAKLPRPSRKLPASSMRRPELRLQARNCCSGSADGGCSARSRPQAGSLSLEMKSCGVRRVGARPKFHGRKRAALRSRAGGDASGESLYHAHRSSCGLDPLSSGPCIEPYIDGYAERKPGHKPPRLAGLGPPRIRNDSSESFNMAYLAIRERGVNGVSRFAMGKSAAAL